MAKPFHQLKSKSPELFQILTGKTYRHISPQPGGPSSTSSIRYSMPGQGAYLLSELFENIVLVTFPFCRRLELHTITLPNSGPVAGSFSSRVARSRRRSNGCNEVLQLTGLSQIQQRFRENFGGTYGFIDAVAEGQLVADLELPAITFGKELLLDRAEHDHGPGDRYGTQGHHNPGGFPGSSEGPGHTFVCTGQDLHGGVTHRFVHVLLWQSNYRPVPLDEEPHSVCADDTSSLREPG